MPQVGHQRSCLLTPRQVPWRRRGAVQLLKPKYAVRDAIRAAGMRPVFITTGFFYEWAFTPNLFDWQSGKVRHLGW